MTDNQARELLSLVSDLRIELREAKNIAAQLAIKFAPSLLTELGIVVPVVLPYPRSCMVCGQPKPFKVYSGAHPEDGVCFDCASPRVTVRVSRLGLIVKDPSGMVLDPTTVELSCFGCPTTGPLQTKGVFQTALPVGRTCMIKVGAEGWKEQTRWVEIPESGIEVELVMERA